MGDSQTLEKRFTAARLDWPVARWAAPANVHAFATTRNGSDGDGFDLGPANLATLDSMTRASTVANRARVAEYLPSPPVYLEQVHGVGVVTVDSTNVDAFRDRAPSAHGAVTRLAGMPLAVRVADCLPVLLSDDRGSVVAAAHAGWRGLAAGVLEATVERMGVDPPRLVAWLGPAIGPAAFEVGEDVREAFRADTNDAQTRFVAIKSGKWLADLAGLACDRLVRVGVRRIDVDGSCTYSEPRRFFSWRRDRSNARMAAYVFRAAAP